MRVRAFVDPTLANGRLGWGTRPPEYLPRLKGETWDTFICELVIPATHRAVRVCSRSPAVGDSAPAEESEGEREGHY